MDPLPLKDLNLVMVTENPAHKITFQWSIQNINKIAGPIRSSKFALVSGQPREWDVILWLNANDSLQFILACHAQKNACPILVRSDSRILKNQGSVLEHDYHTSNVFYGGVQHPLYIKAKFSELREDRIVFQCSMTVYGYGLVCSRNLYYDDDQNFEELGKNFLSMLKSEEFADVKIKVRNTSFAVHKCVLKCLATKFFSCHQEKIVGGEFPVMGQSPEVFKAILESIYGGRVSQTDIAMDYEEFHNIAVRYELRRVLRACTKEIIYNMKPSNVSGYYMLADVNKDEELMKYCEAFMKDNVRDVECDPFYGTLCSSRPHLPRSSNVGTTCLEDYEMP